jgi:hypothetical protein
MLLAAVAGPASAQYGYGGYGGYGPSGCTSPSIRNLQPANNCGVYKIDYGTDSHGNCTATFTVWNTQPQNGDCVTGFAAYWVGPGYCKPICQSAPSNCDTQPYGQYCQSIWDYHCYSTCNQGGGSTSGGYSGSTNCGGSSTGGYSGSTNCGGSSTGGYGGSTGGYGGTTGCGAFTLGGSTTCGSTSGGYSGSTNCGGSTGGYGGYGNNCDYGQGSSNCGGCWYGNCNWFTSCIAPGNCSHPQCFTLTYPKGTQLCDKDFECGMHCYKSTGCDYWCMCGQPCMGMLSVTPYPTSVCITNSESTQLSYTVKNTGTMTVNNISVTDNFGTVANIATLAPGASTTVTRTISGQNTTFTDDISVTGTDTYGDKVNSGAMITVHVVHPALTLTASAGPLVGNQVTVTYVLTNTGDDTINNITVTGNVNGTPTVLTTVASLAPNASQTITQTVTVNGPTTVYATANGTDSCSMTYVKVTSAPVQPPATITGMVSCATCTCPVKGATVQLLNSSSVVVATTTTNATGSFTFANEATGTYSIDVVDSPDYQTYTGPQFAFNSSGNNVSEGTIGLSASPISYLSQQGEALGQVYFATASVWTGAGYTLGTTPVGPADLSTNNFVSSTTVFPYTGALPDYPELGSFSGNIYVLVVSPLVNANVWNSSSFVNLVGLFDVWPLTGGGTEGTSSQFTIRTMFDQPFTGPGTAYNYAISGLSFTTPTPAPPSSVTSEPAIWVGAGPMPATPAAGTFPAGWMAQSQVQFVVPASTSFTFFINGSYNDICGTQFTFSICPTGFTPF